MTFRVDVTWGLSHRSIRERNNTQFLTRPIEGVVSDPYERCKLTHRCPRGWTLYEQSSAIYESTMQYFPGGKHIDIPLFIDFEDWRQGTRGWQQSCDVHTLIESSLCLPIQNQRNNAIPNNMFPRGAHWSSFSLQSLGPSIPSFNSTSNNGLVLNRGRLFVDVQKQKEKMQEIERYLHLLKIRMNQSSLNANSRTRFDLKKEMTRTYNDYKRILQQENHKMLVLSNSQCSHISCALLFNTSDLTLTGAVNVTGVISISQDGSEIATWTFDSIDIGREVDVKITGQRAIALLSRSSTHIDTVLKVHPGTLGGFPGGYSVSRSKNNRLNSVCSEGLDGKLNTLICTELKKCCNVDESLVYHSDKKQSNNINGPGSPSVRVYLFT